MIAWMLLAVLAAPLQEAPAPEGGGDDVVEKLVQRIQQDLADVDRLLEQAADEDDPKDPLAAAREAHVRTITDLEKLIRQVKYRRGGGGGKGGQGGESEQSGQSQANPQRGADDRSQAQQAPSPQEQEGAQGQPKPKGGQQPVSGAADPSAAEQRDARSPPPPAQTGDFLRQDTDARWGVLPPKLQERLMNLHVDDVPERYRTWLEAYVRELNRRDTAGGGP